MDILSWDSLSIYLRQVGTYEHSETRFQSDEKLKVSGCETAENIVLDSTSNETIVLLNTGDLHPPMGGVSFNMDPLLKENDVVVSLGIRYKIKFPSDFHWNQGGHLPGIYGFYTAASSSAAAANHTFDGKCRWDAKGKLCVHIKQNCENDPNEWLIDQQSKVQIEREMWYEISIIAHIDGLFQVQVNDSNIFSGSSHLGFGRLLGVRFSAYCMDNLGIENSCLSIKDLEIKANVDETTD